MCLRFEINEKCSEATAIESHNFQQHSTAANVHYINTVRIIMHEICNIIDIKK